jgi:hypothetical protein
MTIACPRCDYDLSGASAAWERECPLLATCSECGLGFAWGDLLNPRLLEESRFFEHARFRRERAFWVTLGRVFRPRKFWRWVRIEAPAHRRRMWLFVVLALVLLHLSAVITYGVGLAWLTWDASQQPGLVGLWQWFEDSSEQLLSAASMFLWINEGYFVGRSSFRFDLYVTVLPPPLLACLATLLIPVAFFALPQSMRACRVRRGHLVRVLAYSAVPIPLLLIAATGLGMLWDWGFYGRGGYWRMYETVSHALPWLQALLVFVWQVVWWHAAVRHYLRMPHAWAVSVAITLIATLAAAVPVLITMGRAVLAPFV